MSAEMVFTERQKVLYASYRLGGVEKCLRDHEGGNFSSFKCTVKRFCREEIGHDENPLDFQPVEIRDQRLEPVVLRPFKNLGGKGYCVFHRF